MTADQASQTRFSIILWMALATLLALLVGFVAYVRAEKQIDHEHEHMYRSLLLMNELRQSSDDLTRMVRVHVATGNPLYRKIFQEIIDIRDGRSPRPVDYQGVYWDLVLADDLRPRPLGPARPLLERMREEGFGEQEFSKLAVAKQASDDLTRIEIASMALLAAEDPVGVSTRLRAVTMLHDETYLRAKAGVMQPISEVERMVSARTQAAVGAAEKQALQLRWFLIALAVLQAVLLWQLGRRLYGILGGSVGELFRHVELLGRGDFSTEVPVPSGRGDSVLGWLAALRGKLARLELRQFKAIVESTDDAIISKSLDGNITSWNAGAERIFGYTAGEAIGRSSQMLLPQDRLDEEPQIMARIQRGERIRNFDTVRRHKQGHAIDVSVTMSPILDDSDRVIGVSKIARDIGERKLVEAEILRLNADLEQRVGQRTAELEQANRSLTVAMSRAEAANRAKSAFLANMSHEIRTPMNGIVGLANILQREGVSPKQADRLDKIHVATQHLLGIINDILDLSKIEAGHLELEEVPLVVASLLANVESIIGARAKAKGIMLVLEADFLSADLVGDPTRLQQALLNYVTNAIKFTDGGTVRLRMRKVEDAPEHVVLRFEVEDTGSGIEPEALGRLFRAFEQADNSMTRKYGGTGLGLAITRNLAELMGGAAGASSTLGVGSTFWFTARLRKHRAPAVSEALAADDVEGRVRRQFAGCRVLVVDDEPINREVAAMYLESVGLLVDAARDGAEAVTLAQKTAYAAILMDMQMPHLNGLEATRRIRALPVCRDVPIIAMTANAFAEDKALCFEAGMDEFLAKPFDSDLFFSILLRALGRATT